MHISAIILAAGQGKRMRSSLPKVLHPVLGRPMIAYVIDALKKVAPQRFVFILGHGADKVKEAVNLEEAEYVFQDRQWGTAHAANCARPALTGFEGSVLILNGDLPLIRGETLTGFINEHFKVKATVSILTAGIKDPTGYGRVVRDERGDVLRVVEEKDASQEEKRLNEINSGAYCIESGFLWGALDRINTLNQQQEYYLPDIINIASSDRKKINGCMVEDHQEVLGVNNREELAQVEQILRKRVNHNLMQAGVTMINPETTYIAPSVEIGADTVIYPHTFIYGNTEIGEGCTIGPSVWIENSSIGNQVSIKFSSYITETRVEGGVSIGPFAHLRPETKIMAGAKIGNFVEIKKSIIGPASKVPHLSYVGDATLGQGVNIGAGTITCNYDGFDKHHTIIEDNVFIGSDTMLVAPVVIGKGATTGAGSTITRDVPEGTLAIGRAKQVTISNWRRKRREKKESD